ncbi:MAG: ATP-binding protein [Proteobacteria bacterium]|nr:ATP-binding protein [Pseudomonadota bacterium]
MSAINRAPSATARFGRRRWRVGVLATVAFAVGLVLLFLLILATDNRQLYEEYFVWLLGLNVSVAVALGGVIAWLLWRLWQSWRSGRFGRRLLLKLAAIFALVGVLPGALVYVVSYQFVNRSIQNWFDVKVEGALVAGLNLGRNTVDLLSVQLTARTRAAAQSLTTSSVLLPITLERLREQLDAHRMQVWSDDRRLLGSVGAQAVGFTQSRAPPSWAYDAARSRGMAVWVEGMDGEPDANTYQEATISALAWVVVPSLSLRPQGQYLQVTVLLPNSLAEDARRLQTANQEYQERALARDGLRRMYIGTLTLALFLTVFGAMIMAALLANQLARPLLLLAEGVRDVARGDLTPKLSATTRDEIGELTRDFADMTQQLADARADAQNSLHHLEQTRASLQTLLDNLSAGVVVLSEDDQVLQLNPQAAQLLDWTQRVALPRALAQPGSTQTWIETLLGEFERRIHDGDSAPWQRSLSVHSGQGSEGVAPAERTLMARGAWLPDGTRLLVLDDITTLVSGQRAQAWADVARRLAHEIKNPLTPIQLSAERLQHKLTERVPADAQALLHKSVQTIVEQVEAMKRMVNEFRDYARLPTATLRPLDLKALVRDVAGLYEETKVPIEWALDDVPEVQADAEQLRQVLHNLVQNAQDACADVAQPQVGVSLRVGAQGRRVHLSVRDNGPGFAPQLLARAFEPYVTTKPKGTGLGLAVVKKIADEHHADVRLRNLERDGVVEGAQVSVSFSAVQTQVA